MCSEGLRERYVNPYTDFAFKLLFGTDLNKEILIGFLNALFDGKQVIEDVTYLNTEHLGSKEFRNKKEKGLFRRSTPYVFNLQSVNIQRNIIQQI